MGDRGTSIIRFPIPDSRFPYSRINMRILLERRSLQGEAHLEREGVRGERLTTFLASLEAVAGTHAPRWSEGPVTEEALAGADVFIVPTKLEPYTRAEGDAIEAFVARGSGLWILSNHRPFHEADGLLASRFGVVLESTFLRTVGATTVIRGENLRPHAVLESDGGKVEALVTNTTCSIRSEKGRRRNTPRPKAPNRLPRRKMTNSSYKATILTSL